MKLSDWFKARQRVVIDEPAPTPVPILPPHVPDLTLEQWQKMPDLVTEAKKLQANPVFIHMLAVMKSNSPAHYHVKASGVQPSDAILHLGEIQGYNIALNMLAAFAKPFTAPKTVPSSFAPPIAPERKPEPWKAPPQPKPESPK